MTEAELTARIERARELLREIHTVAVSTVNEDGSPHCSPVFMAFDRQLRGFWSSDPESLHSRNIERDGHAFLVLFDSRNGHGGLYAAAQAGLVGEHELERAHATFKAAAGHPIGNLSAYTGSSPQRLYQAIPDRIWVNQSERDQGGIIVRDRRFEISLDRLLPSKE